MIIEEFTKIIGKTKPRESLRVKLKCDICGREHERPKYGYLKLLENEKYDKDQCKSCWEKYIHSKESYRINMSKSITRMYKNNPDISEKKRISMLGKNSGISNGMKQKTAREKVSIARKKMFKDHKIREHYSNKTKEAWASGKFDGIQTGFSKWHEYISKSGKMYKVQGNYELKFLKWLDENCMKFEVHKGRIPYTLNGKRKNYYPDFYVYDWECYVDTKAKYWYDKTKFDAIYESTNIKLKILFEEDLKKLGIEL